jgi:hypothetical protein
MRHPSFALAFAALSAACALPPRSTARSEDSASSSDATLDASADSEQDASRPSDVADASVGMDAADVFARPDARPDASPDAGPDVVDTGVDSGVAARITGRVRFLSSGTITVTFNGVARTYAAAANAAPIAIDVVTPVPAMRHEIEVTANSSGQTCTVRLPSPAPTTELSVTGVEVRCVMATQQELTSAIEATVELPGSATPAQRDLTQVDELVINQPDAVSVLASVTIPTIRFDSTNSLGVVEVGFVDQPSNVVVGRISVRRANGNINVMHTSATAILRLAPGPHRIRPTFRHFDVAGRPAAHIVYGVRPLSNITVPSDGPLKLTYSAIVLDSLSTYEDTEHATWMPSASEPPLTAGAPPRLIPFATVIRPSIPANGGAIYAFTPPMGTGPVQWDLLADSILLARGMAFYDEAPMPHAMLAAQPSSTAITPAISAQLSRYNYRNSFGPNTAPVILRTPIATSYDSTQLAPAALTPALLSAARFSSGVRMFAARATGGRSWATSTSPTPQSPPGLAPIRVSLAAPRKVYFFARLASARVASDGPAADVSLVARTAATATTRVISHVSVVSSNAQNSQGMLVAGLVDLPAGEHELQLFVRPVTSMDAIPAGGITTAFPFIYTADLVDDVPLGHVSIGALVLE